MYCCRRDWSYGKGHNCYNADFAPQGGHRCTPQAPRAAHLVDDAMTEEDLEKLQESMHSAHGLGQLTSLDETSDSSLSSSACGKCDLKCWMADCRISFPLGDCYLEVMDTKCGYGR